MCNLLTKQKREEKKNKKEKPLFFIDNPSPRRGVSFEIWVNPPPVGGTYFSDKDYRDSLRPTDQK